MQNLYTPPENAPILDSLDVIQNELIRLKAIEQAAKDLVIVYDAIASKNGSSAPDSLFYEATLSYNNLKELL